MKRNLLSFVLVVAVAALSFVVGAGDGDFAVGAWASGDVLHAMVMVV